MNLFKNVLLVMGGILYAANARLVIDENTPNHLFDEELYKSVIDSDECRRQVNYLKRTDSALLAQFLDAGVRFPRGLFTLNSVDLGNYEQCLGIISENDDIKIEGKYYLIRVPFDQEFKLPFDTPYNLNVTNENIVRVKKFFNGVQDLAIRTDAKESDPDFFQTLSVVVSVCVPKPCTTQDWITNMLFNVTAFGFKYDEIVVRLPDDKPWVPADYVAIAIFSALGFITLLSTFYDINHNIIQRRDPKKANIFLRTFSFYTNTRRLVTFTPNVNALDCLDGLRTISMMWVVVGHVFQMDNVTSNMSDVLKWITSADAVWITTAHNAVDSFLLMAGILLTYTTVGKMNGGQFLKRLHAFYLNRLLRMFPLLAAAVLLEASVFHRVADGPYWENTASGVQNCRSFWWTTLLHIQNFANPDHLCVRHSWYIAIDIQLHIVSPIILYWMLGKTRKAAWIALIAGLLVVVTTATVWNFIMNSASTSIALLDADVQSYYFHNYYYLPWTRAAPFFFGMIVGYVLYLYKGKEINLNKGFVVTSWLISLGLIASNFYVAYATMQFDWDNQVADNFINTFMKLIWSVGLSWIIFACVKGYGGPVNWFLSLNLWKLPARISFAMYLYHYPLTFIISGTHLAPDHFSVGSRIYEFMSVFTLTFLISFVMTVAIDAPFSVLTKILMEGGQRRSRKPQDNVNSQSGPVPKKNVQDLEGTIATNLEKNDPIIRHLVKNCVSNDINGIPNKTEKHSEFIASRTETERL